MKSLSYVVLFVRTMLFRLGFGLFTLVYGTISVVVAFPLPFKYRIVVIRQWVRGILFWLRLTCGVSHQIVGRENIPEETCVILCKHSSTWETLSLTLFFDMPAILSKKSLLKIPFFGWMLAMCRPIAIDREHSSSALKEVLKQGKARLAEGRKVLIFPEGTRVPPGQQEPYKPGGVLLAKRSHQKLLLVSHNAGLFWSDSSFLIKPGKIVVTISPLMDTKDEDTATLNEMSMNWIESHTNV
jgi:1-acyl-sn-glycerol-3-phosphate acyltransferase